MTLSKNELNKRKRRCTFCSKTFLPRPLHRTDQKFCTQKCFRASRSNARSKEFLCINCAKPFRRRFSNIGSRNFCSRACSSKQRVLKPKLNLNDLNARKRPCIFCRKTFLPKQSSNKKQRFCTSQCFYEYRKSQAIECLCFQCGAKFYRKKSLVRTKMFCSKACLSKRPGPRPKKPKLFTCQYCREVSTIANDNKRKKYCSYVCNSLARRTSTRPDDARLAGRLATWGRKVRKRDGNKCVRCGSRYKLQAHHKLRFSEYPELRYEVDNGETLCIDCHAKEHPEIAHLIKSKLI